MWKCTYCGNENNNNDKYCGHCGKEKESSSDLRAFLPILISVSLAVITGLILCFIFLDKREPILKPDPEPAVTAAPATPEPVSTPNLPTPSPAPASSWGEWSEWSTEPVLRSDDMEVETRKTAAGYNMVHYGTQMEEDPHYRMFRSFSIQNDFDRYGARSSYGEKHFTRYATAEELNGAAVYHEGAMITGEYAGYQCGRSDAYFFGDDKYVWFIESTDEVTEYRYRQRMG